MNPRPHQLVCFTGTHTEVGKTWVGAQLLAHAKATGLSVAARKPVQSFDEAGGDTDALVLSRATGEPVESICPTDRCYPLALAPPMAADLLQRPPIRLADIMREIRWPAGIDLGLEETVGGLRSPLAHDGDSIDLVEKLEPDAIVLVADAGLGTLNAVRLSLASLHPTRVVVFLNRFDEGNELHRLNREWLRGRYGVDACVAIDTLLQRLLRTAA